MQCLSVRAKTMLRSAITSTVSLLAIALANPQMARAEFFWCAAKGFTWTKDAAGNDLRQEKAEIRLMVQVDGPKGNVKYREPIEGDDWDCHIDGRYVQQMETRLHQHFQV